MLPDLSSPMRALPAVFLGGVLTSLTPCIYPMIPITAAIVGGTSVGEQAAGTTRPPRWRPALLTLTYVLGLALVYSALGLFAGLTGTLFGSVSTNPWLYFAMANLLRCWTFSRFVCRPRSSSAPARREQRDARPVRLPWGRCPGWLPRRARPR